MTTNTDNWNLCVVHEVCPICCSALNASILSILPEDSSKETAEEIKNMDGKAIGFSDEPCKNCQEKINKGYIALIGLNETKTEIINNSVNLKDIYRIGLLWFQRQVAEKVFVEWTELKRPEPFILLDSKKFNFFAEKAAKPKSESNEKSQSTET